MPTMSLADVPEELIERILSIALTEPISQPLYARPLWHRRPAPSTTPLTLLLVSRKLNRISTALIYARLTIYTRKQALLLARTLSARPVVAACVRSVVACGCWDELGSVLSCLGPRMEALDFMLDSKQLSEEPVRLNGALAGLTSLRHLIVRKTNSSYTSHPHIKSIIAALAEAIRGWTRLETVNIAFRLSDDAYRPLSPTQEPSANPAPAPAPAPARALADALSCAPMLHTLFAQLPAVWSPLLLLASRNARLERIVLDPVETAAGWVPGEGVLGTAAFMREAKKCARLMDLLRAGTPIIRTRARTIGMLSPTMGDLSFRNVRFPCIRV